MPLDTAGTWAGQVLIDHPLDRLDERGLYLRQRPRDVAKFGTAENAWFEPITGALTAMPLYVPMDCPVQDDPAVPIGACSGLTGTWRTIPRYEQEYVKFATQVDTAAAWAIETVKELEMNEPFYIVLALFRPPATGRGIYTISFGQDWQIRMISRTGVIFIDYYVTDGSFVGFLTAVQLRMQDPSLFFNRKWFIHVWPLKRNVLRVQFDRHLIIEQWFAPFRPPREPVDIEDDSLRATTDTVAIYNEYISPTNPNVNGELLWPITRPASIKVEGTGGACVFGWRMQQYVADRFSFFSPVVDLGYTSSQFGTASLVYQPTANPNTSALVSSIQAVILPYTVDDNGFNELPSGLVPPYRRLRYSLVGYTNLNATGVCPVLYLADVTIPSVLKVDQKTAIDRSGLTTALEIKRSVERGASSMDIMLTSRDGGADISNLRNIGPGIPIFFQVGSFNTSNFTFGTNKQTYFIGRTHEAAYDDSSQVPTLRIVANDPWEILRHYRYWLSLPDYSNVSHTFAVRDILRSAGFPPSRIGFTPQPGDTVLFPGPPDQFPRWKPFPGTTAAEFILQILEELGSDRYLFFSTAGTWQYDKIVDYVAGVSEFTFGTITGNPRDRWGVRFQGGFQERTITQDFVNHIILWGYDDVGGVIESEYLDLLSITDSTYKYYAGMERMLFIIAPHIVTQALADLTVNRIARRLAKFKVQATWTTDWLPGLEMGHFVTVGTTKYRVVGEQTNFIGADFENAVYTGERDL